MKPALSGRRLVIAVALILTAQFGMAQTTLSKAEVEKRVVSILSQMTLEEKINIIGGVNDFYTRPMGKDARGDSGTQHLRYCRNRMYSN